MLGIERVKVGNNDLCMGEEYLEKIVLYFQHLFLSHTDAAILIGSTTSDKPTTMSRRICCGAAACT